MQTGIIGLPQVGKTTLFRILTKANVDAKGAQAAHVGVAKVPEPRLIELAKLYNPKKITYASVQYVDLPGVQKERMRESLATLRDVDAIAHVIRVFDDPSVPHSEGTIDPLRDVTNLDLELIFSDHEQITKRLERLEKDLKKKKDPQFELEKVVLEKCKAHLEAEKPLRELELTPEERKPIGGFLFLSQRPMLFVHLGRFVIPQIQHLEHWPLLQEQEAANRLAFLRRQLQFAQRLFGFEMRFALLEHRFFPFQRGILFLFQVLVHALQPLGNLFVVGENQLKIQIGHVAQRVNAAFGMRHAGIVEHANDVGDGIDIPQRCQA